MIEKPLNPAAKSPPEILRDMAEKFERGEIRSFYLCVVSRDGKPGSVIHAAGPPHYPHDLREIGEHSCQLLERIEGSISVTGFRR